MQKRITTIIVGLLITVPAAISLVETVFAQDNGPFYSTSGWSERIIVYEELNSDYVHNGLSLIADAFGNVHLMWRLVDHNGDRAVASFYSHWDGRYWTTPVDVLVSPDNDQFSGAEMVVDTQGRLHAIWNGANGLYYSWSWFDQATSAANWSVPVRFPSRSFEQTISAEGQDRLHVLYTEAGMQMFYLASRDGGATWLQPVQLSATPPDGSASAPRITADATGTLHAVWSEGPTEGYPPRAVFYVQSQDGGESWSEPIRVFDNDIGDPNVAVAGDGTIHVFGNGRAGVGGRFHRWSADSGISWSQVENLAPGDRAGLTAEMGLAIDGRGTLHVVYVTENPGIMYTYWTGAQLAPPVPLALSSEEGWWGEGAVVAVAGGNRLHVVVPGASRRIWHIWRALDEAPSVPPLPTPERSAAATPLPTTCPITATADAVSAGPATTLCASLSSASPASTAGASMLPLVVSILPVLILIGLVLGIQLSRRGRR